MASSKKPDPFLEDDDTRPLTAEETKRLKPARDVLAAAGLEPPKRRGRPLSDNPKQRVTLMLDPDVIAFFKGEEPKGWQTRLNAALREKAGLDG